MDIQNFLTRFNRAKRTSGNQYMAQCPSHDDRKNSLSIKYDEHKDCILVNCHAGCSTKEILEKVGLKMKDLYNNDDKKTTIIATTTYNYYDENGDLLYKKVRRDYIDKSKKIYFEKANGEKNMQGVNRVLYNLPQVINSDKVYIVEGEKCADAVIKAGFVATTLDGGAKSPWRKHYNRYLQDKEIIILPDNDEAGMQYARTIATHLPNAKIIKLPDLQPKEDVYDWLMAGHTMAEIDSLPIADLSELLPESIEENVVKETDTKATQSETIISLVEKNNAVLFHDALNDPYVAIEIDEHKEIWSIESEAFNTWVSGLFYKHTKKTVKKENVSQAVTILKAKAQYDSKEAISLGVRINEKDNAFWYDLSNPNWQAVKITDDGWTIENNPPIMFNRFRHQKNQCLPKQDGDIKRILKYINIKENHILFLCWLVCCFIPNMPHAMPIFFGEKGAAKTTACTLLKRIIDPSALETLTIQKNPRSLAVNLQQHWFLPFDNVSKIDEDISDTLCRAITGDGIQQRKLYTNADDYIFTFQKCLAINGINNVARRPDLMDRAILIELFRISENERKELSEIKYEFEQDLPYILGGIFDVLSKAMKIYPTVKLKKLPRMADFTRWGFAIGEALGGKGQEFLDEYVENRKSQNVEIINENIVATLMVAFMNDKAEWNGRISELLQELIQIAPSCGINTKSVAFPSQPNVLSRRLNGLKSNLQSAGITFEIIPKTQGSVITLTNGNLSPLPPYKISSGDILNQNETTAEVEDADESIDF